MSITRYFGFISLHWKLLYRGARVLITNAPLVRQGALATLLKNLHSNNRKDANYRGSFEYTYVCVNVKIAYGTEKYIKYQDCGITFNCDILKSPVFQNSHTTNP